MQILTLLASESGENTWLLPHAPAEAVVAAIASIIVFALIWWKGGPPIKNMWNGRIERIEGEVTNAATARADGEQALTDVRTRIANIDEERNRILGEGRQTAEAVKAQIIAKAEQEAADLRARAAADAESAKAQAASDLEAEVGRLALGAAEEVVERNLDQTTQHDLIEAYINQVAAR
ncbi:MAG: F0F1 ATP synthase subunit B [Acidimicrobiales bacterium]